MNTRANTFPAIHWGDTSLTDPARMIFVFGSNAQGIHGAGAAYFAAKHRGAVYGQGWGHKGNSFAIPTMDFSGPRKTLPLPMIKDYVDAFILYASDPDYQPDFQVTALGCGLAGLKHEQIAPMFEKAPANCYFDTLWKPWLGDTHRYWGTF